MGFKSAHSFVLTPIYFAIAAYFLYKIYNEGLLRYAPWREWQGLPPLNEDAIKSVESPRGGKKISGPSPLVKHLAFLLNTFLFMASPVLMALFFELLPDYMSGVRRSGAESAGTAYAILLILTVGIGLLILLLYAIVGTAGVLLSRFRKGPK